MEIELSYGNGRLELEFPDSAQVDIFSPRSIDQQVSFEVFRDLFFEAGGEEYLSHPSPSVIVNDGYRNTPTSIILGWLNQLDTHFLDRARFLISTGSHEAPTSEHLNRIFGSYRNRLYNRVFVHNALDKTSMVLLGTDSLGGEVWLNRLAVESPATIVIGSVEPHYFAGFTGGRKSIFPGLTDQATIERNHNLANSLDAAPLKLAGNPVAEHLDELMKQTSVDRILGIQLVQNASQQIIGCFCGNLNDAFRKAVNLSGRIYSHKTENKYNLVIAEMRPPLDRNLYQAQKALENCQMGVKDGGTIVIVSACEEGIGSEHFFGLADKWDRERNECRDGRQYFGSHKLSRVNTISRRIDIRLVSRLQAEEIRRVYYEPLDNLQKFIYSIQSDCEKNNIAVVYDAGHTVLTT